MYADIAGLLDSSGDMIELINCLITRMIFNLAKTVKFIVPITKA